MSTARERLDLAILELTQDGLRLRCSWPTDGHMWTSDEHDDRARAARRCWGCPVLDLCREAADEEGERWHVRGGKDYRPNPRARRDRKSA